MLQVERGTLHVYITDMGLARIKMGCTTMTQVGVIGTPYYAAPETFKGEAGTPSDVWGLGMVLLELMVNNMLGVLLRASNIWWER